MAIYTIEVECNAVAQVTGRLGAAVVNYRGHDYRVTLGGKDVTKDGHPIGVDMLPARVYDYARQQYDSLLKAHMNRAA